MKYYRIVINISTCSGNYRSYSIAISEDYQSFLKRQEYDTNIIFLIKCTKKDYDFYRKYNPTNESYAKLKKEDYSKFYKE